MDIQSILGSGGIDINNLAGKINQINPEEILSKFGYNSQEATTILRGDMSPILEKNEQTQVLDYEVIMKSYNSLFNSNLILYFYKKAKDKKAFTEDEIKNYLEAYNYWFDFIFKIGSNFIYTVDKELNDKSILIRVNENVYQMSKIDKINAIIYIKDYVE
jgi:hypothetical protein